MPSIFGLIHCLVILRAYQNMKPHTNSKQRRSANSKDSTKKLQNVRNSSTPHHTLGSLLFSSPAKPILRCERGPTSPCTALSHQSLPVGPAITTGRLEEAHLEAQIDIITLAVGPKVEEEEEEEVIAMPLMPNKDVECLGLTLEVVGPVGMEGVPRIISKAVRMVGQVVVEAQT